MTTADRLRLLADWLDQHPAANEHGSISLDSFGVGYVLDARPDNAEDLALRARAIGGTWNKDAGDTYDTYFYLRQEVVPGIEYQLYARRENVCERVVIGTETIEVPDPDAVAALPLRVEEREIIEWVCPPSLLAQPAGDAR